MSSIGRSDTELLDLAYPYALDAVTSWERRAIERRRRRADRRTAAEFDSTVCALQETLAELSAVDACSPPAELETGLLRALDRAVRAAGRRRLRFGSVPRLGQVAAVLLLLVVFGTGLVVATQRTGEPPASVTAAVIAAQPDALTRTAAVAGGGQLRIESSAALSAAALTFDEVPAPPPGRAYQVWLIALGARPRSAAVLDAVPVRPLVTKLGPSDTLAITVERAAGADQPTSDPIVSASLG
ncbi:anti-sigma factor [Nocardia yunnanensis]|uniref:Regulator of SigK n=1 Tax=Nocardia yunnanensis TaxID=2382165 RepID=A0A386ZEE2_9NOCA|nr:anti-sigma factor [Nocardia yunnanensis]AYF75868.1 anti-sigma factor [Nocardia yunnanensis]